MLTDADWAGCQSTCGSTSSFRVFLGDNLLSWSAKRQHTLSRSIAEVEYQSVANVVAETAWLCNLLRELHSPLSTATLVYCDNVNAFYMSVNPVQHQRTKHIEIDIHFVRDMVTAGQSIQTVVDKEMIWQRLHPHHFRTTATHLIKIASQQVQQIVRQCNLIFKFFPWSSKDTSSHIIWFDLDLTEMDGCTGYSKEQMKQNILKQHSIFRHQIQELHRLYKRQRDLMNELTRKEHYAFFRVFAEDYGTMGLRYGTPNLSAGATFIQELHRLYKRQRDLMNELTRKEHCNVTMLTKAATSRLFLSQLLSRKVVDLELPADVDGDTEGKQPHQNVQNFTDLNKQIQVEEASF
ncbi:ribonuclease H-like domain-containing protein [Tanacetum coccineum]